MLTSWIWPAHLLVWCSPNSNLHLFSRVQGLKKKEIEMWLSESYALIICIINFISFFFFSSKDEFAIVENNIKLFTELPLVAWNASCIFLYWGLLGRRDFKCLHPIVHISVPRLWRLLCDPFRRGGEFVPSQGDSSLTLLTFFQLINKLTDLPYAKSHVSPRKYLLNKEE